MRTETMDFASYADPHIHCWAGITTPGSLRRKRPYIIVGTFVFGMLLIPPGVFPQILLAEPMWLLFEVDFLIARFYQRDDTETEEEF